MKVLIVIRHAKSSWSDSDASDFDRVLNARGKEDAPFMAKKLKELGVDIDHIISSSAKRTKLTCDYFLKELGMSKKQVSFHEGLYLADPSKIIEHINAVDDSVKCLAYIGHNNGLTDFVNLLCSENIENVPTSGICVIDLPTFENLQFGQASLREFIYPKKF